MADKKFNLDRIRRAAADMPEALPADSNREPQKPAAQRPQLPPAPPPVQVPEQTITPQGRQDVAEKVLADDYWAGTELTEADQQAIRDLEAYRRQQGRELRTSPKADLAAAIRFQEAARMADRPEALLAQEREDLVKQLEQVYGEKGLPLPEEYNVPFKERSFMGKVEEGIADIIPFQTQLSERSRKRKVDPDIEPYFPVRLAELGTYPVRAVAEAVTGAPVSEPFGSEDVKDIAERSPTEIRPEVLKGNLQGLRSVSAIDTNLINALDEYERLEQKPLEITADFYAFGPEKGLEVAQQAREQRLAQLTRRIEALSKEKELVNRYVESLRR
jgi:hypothetical protein